MVLGGDGEEWHDGEAEAVLELLGQANRGQSLVQGEQGADEEAGLLAGGDEDPPALDGAGEAIRKASLEVGGELGQGLPA